MNKRSVILIIALGFLGACTTTNGTEIVHPLELVLSFDKRVYQRGEQVVASIVLRNIGGESLLINSYMAVNLPVMPSPVRGMAFVILDPSRDKYVPDIYIDSRPPKIEDFVVLAPGEMIERKFYPVSYGYDFSKLGMYTVIANYQNLIDPSALEPNDKRMAWKGEIDSNPAYFTTLP